MECRLALFAALGLAVACSPNVAGDAGSVGGGGGGATVGANDAAVGTGGSPATSDVASSSSSSSSSSGGSAARAGWPVLGAASSTVGFDWPFVAVDPSGDIIIAADYLSGPGIFGMSVPCASGANFIMLARVSPDGAVKWTRCAEQASVGDDRFNAELRLRGITVSPAGRIALLASANGAVNYEGTEIASTKDVDTRPFLLFVDDADGAYVSSLRFSMPESQDSSGWALGGDNEGNIYLGGYATQLLQLGHVSLSPSPLSVFVAKLDAAGVGQWISEVGHAVQFEASTPLALSLSPDGSFVALTGTFQGIADVGDGVDTQWMTPFAAELDTSSGFIDWEISPPGYGEQGAITAATFDSDDNLVIGGSALQTLDIGGGAFLPNDGAFAAKLDRTGAVIWQAPFADVGPAAFAPNADGGVSFALNLDKPSVSLGGQTFTCPAASAQGSCVVVGRVDAGGVVGADGVVLAGGAQSSASALVAGNGQRLVAGSFHDWLDDGRGRATLAPAGFGVFLTAVSP